MASLISCSTVSSKNGSDGSGAASVWAETTAEHQRHIHMALIATRRRRMETSTLEHELQPEDLAPERGAVRHGTSFGIIDLLPERIHLNPHEAVQIPVHAESRHLVGHGVNRLGAGISEGHVVAW